MRSPRPRNVPKVPSSLWSPPRRRKFFLNFLIFISFIGATTALYFQSAAWFGLRRITIPFSHLEVTRTSTQWEDLRKEVEELNRDLAALRDQQRQLLENPTNNLAPIVAELADLKTGLHQLSDTTVALRQALTPNPEEQLTIARLNDKVVDLTRRFDRLDSDLAKKYDAFTASTLREISTASSATWALTLALIPLLLHFAYSLWRDSRRPAATPKDE